MGIFKRAYLYVTRKKVRSILLFLIMLVTGLFLLVGLSIRASAQKAADEVRKTMNTGLVLEMNPISGEHLFELAQNEDGEMERRLKVPLLTQSKLEQLLDIDGVCGFFSEMGHETLYTGLEVRPGGYSKELRQIEETDPQGLNESLRQSRLSDETYSHTNGFYLIEDGRWHPFFANGALELTQGRHIETGDYGKAVISEELAKMNGLQIGDRINSYNFDFITGEQYGTAFESEIVGIFRINFEQDLSNWTSEDNIFANIIFADPNMRHWAQVEYNTHYGNDVLARESDRVISEVTLFVEDPLMLDSVKEQVLANDTVDWSYYSLKRYDHDYQAAAGPLRTMVKLSTVLAVIMAAGALAVLSLILTMWVRSRKREIGILASIGVKKQTTLAQFLLECCVVAAAAFLLAGLLAGPVTDVIGNGLAGMVSSPGSAQPFEVVIDQQSNVMVNKMPDAEVSLTYHLTPGTASGVFLTMLLVSVTSVVVSSMRVIRQKPRDILGGG